MSLHLTPEILKASYGLLNVTQPFIKWNLPDHDDINFRVVKDTALYGWYERRKNKHSIGISAKTVGHLETLIRAMAHEMIHVHQKAVGLRLNHGKAFRGWASEVCKYHGFDPLEFC